MAPSVEIVVLGKGVGESVLIGLGDEWVVVDSFETTSPRGDDRVPAPLAYLRSRGIDPPEAVTGVVLSHLHADHLRGIDEVVLTCRRANFFLPRAIPDGRWGRLLATEVPGSDRIAKDIVARAFRYAGDRDRFREVGATSVLDIRSDEIIVIAPSHRASKSARTPLGELDPAGAAQLLDQNYTSIVLFVRAGAAVALLGADMDADGRLGWPRLLVEHQDKAWLCNAGFVKVPHHGSITAFEPAMYSTWTNDAVGVLTPNGSRLPTQPMITTLTEVTRLLYQAGPARARTLGLFDTEGPSQAYFVRATCDRASGSRWEVDPPAHAHQVLPEAPL